MKLKTTLTIISCFLLLVSFISSKAQTNLLQGSNMEAETGWTTSYIGTASGSEPAGDWNYTTAVPTAGTAGSLHVTGSGSGSNAQYAIYQQVDLTAGETYTFDAAYLVNQHNNFWCEVFVGTKPADDQDYGGGQSKLAEINSWWALTKDDGTFLADAGGYNPFVADTSGTYYFVLKVGCTGDGSFDIILDEPILTDRAEPIVKFNSDLPTGFPGVDITFTDESIYPVSWAWDFGDGTTSTDQNPTHAYAAIGKYTVTLAVTNELGTTTLVKTDMIEITEPPLEVTAGGILLGGEMESDSDWTISFLDNSGAAPTATWNYTDDGPTAGTGGSLHVTGTGAGSNVQYAIYQAVKLSSDSVYSFEGAFKAKSLANSWCEVFIGEEPIDGLDYGSGRFVLSKFSQWGQPAKSDGTFTIDAAEYNQFVPDTSGTYYFVLKVGCTGDGNYEIMLDELSLTKSRTKPFTAFSADKPLGFAPLTVKFTDESKFATSWEWNFGDGSAVSNEQNPTHEYAQGTYSVTLKATNEKGDSILVRTDYIKANEKPTLPPGEKLYGGNMEDPNLWNITTLNSSNVTTATWNYTADTPIAGAGGCLYLSADLDNGESQFCIWQEVELHKDSSYNFDGAFKTLSSLNNVWNEVFIGTVAPKEGSDYGADSIKIAQFNTWASCTGNSVDGTYQVDGCFLMPDFQPKETGKYYFAIKVGTNSQDKFEILIDELTLQESTYFAAPVANFFADVVSGNAPLTVYFTDQSENATSWAWDFGDGGTSTEQHPEHTYTTPGLYTVTLTAMNGSRSAELVVTDLILVEEGVFVKGYDNINMDVYPNPSNGQVHIDLPELTSGVLRLTGLIGNEIMRREVLSESRISLNIENKGIYLLIFNSNDGQITSKIVIE